MLHWFKSFLTNRLQRVVIEGYYSSPSKVTSGVPQGTVLGPILFLVYINDLITYINSTIRSADHQLLQQDLNALSNWAAKWQMKFNVTRFWSYLNTTAKVDFHILWP